MQLIVSLGQIYGDVLYYATSSFDEYYNGLAYCRPEAYYYWFYYFFMNIIWIIVPGCTFSKLGHTHKWRHSQMLISVF
jgi:cholestenol delta-isomerase